MNEPTMTGHEDGSVHAEYHGVHVTFSRDEDGFAHVGIAVRGAAIPVEVSLSGRVVASTLPVGEELDLLREARAVAQAAKSAQQQAVEHVAASLKGGETPEQIAALAWEAAARQIEAVAEDAASRKARRGTQGR